MLWYTSISGVLAGKILEGLCMCYFQRKMIDLPPRQCKFQRCFCAFFLIFAKNAAESGCKSGVCHHFSKMRYFGGCAFFFFGVKKY